MHDDDRWSPLLPADDAPLGPRDFAMCGKVWRWKGDSGFYFVTVPEDVGQTIRQRFGKTARGWGSIKVRVTVGDTTWATSLFPHKAANSYLCAIKAEVRKAEGIEEGDAVEALLHVL